jgi:transcriptional regulator with XRE-family HTH domain
MKVDGEAVKAARKAKMVDGREMSRELLAVRVGVSADTIARVEQNRGDVAAGTAYLIAQELEVPLESLFTENGAAA